MFDKEKMLRFVKKVNGGPGIDIKISRSFIFFPEAWVACAVYKYNTIVICPKYWEECKRNDNEIRMLLLHEVGHFNTDHSIATSKSEYETQKWAINKAIELKMWNVAKDLINQIEDWNNYKWNVFRPYVLCSKIAKKTRFVSKSRKKLKAARSA